MALNSPDNSAGSFTHIETYNEDIRDELVDVNREAPAQLRQSVTDLSDVQLDTIDKSWTVRQMVHHLADNKSGDIQPPLAMLNGLHAKWVQILCSITKEQFKRTFHHPQSGETVSVWLALHYDAWHGQRQTSQISWLSEQHGWKRDCP